MDKTTVLLGAGAMIPFGGPTTNDLTQALLRNNICKNFFCPIFNRTNQTVDFEFLLSSLENLLDWKLANEEPNSRSSNPYMLLEPFFPYQYDLIKDIWVIYRESINTIIDIIKEYDYYTPPVSDKMDTLARFLICKKHNNLKIYSLNYDRLIPRLLQKYGLYFYEGLYKEQYEYDLNKFNSYSNTYFNLHGSIYTSYVSFGVVKISDSPIELEYRFNIQGGNPSENKVFLPIIAGYSKSQRIMSEPFNFGIAALMNDCNTCNRLVIVGYSFGDPHINAILRKFVKLDSTEIVIVDYCKDDKLHDGLRGIPYQVFGIPGAQFIGERNALYLDKNPHIHLYLDGFEQFIIDNMSL